MSPWESLPTSIEIAGKEYKIRTDYRDALNIFEILNDVELDNRDKFIGMVTVFFEDPASVPEDQYDSAVNLCYWFLNGGDTFAGRNSPKLMDWEQDFRYIAAPINRVIGKEIRSIPYMHWWSFLSAYYEIGDCLFAQIVRIRSLKAKGKMDKDDRRWYQENRELVDFKARYTSEEEDFVNRMMGKK